MLVFAKYKYILVILFLTWKKQKLLTTLYIHPLVLFNAYICKQINHFRDFYFVFNLQPKQKEKVKNNFLSIYGWQYLKNISKQKNI